ncbi:MAG TPA: hypothetical protein VIV60_00465 [Polyangiaceae bacterium]
MSENPESPCLLLVELGATVPNWLERKNVACLEQGSSESHGAFADRASRWLTEHTVINTVIVALHCNTVHGLEERVRCIGKNVTRTLRKRPRARLLFGAPADVPERQRRQILGLTAELAQPDPDSKSSNACIVGAHFSANPPSSSKIPL